jgi:hypothetical protein
MASVRKKYRNENGNGADDKAPVAAAPQAAAAAQSAPAVASETPTPARGTEAT